MADFIEVATTSCGTLTLSRPHRLSETSENRTNYVNNLKVIRGEIDEINRQSLQRYKQLRSGLTDLSQQLDAAFEPAAIN